LRQRIYTRVRPHEPPPVPAGFSLVAQERLAIELAITDKVLVKALLSMTPFAWRLSRELCQQLENEGLKDQLDFGIYLYKPTEHLPDL
jgi:hypothetical protein